MNAFSPVYEGIKQALKAQIEGGQLSAGDRIPSELQLAREFGVSRSQTRPALRELQLEGYLVRKQGSGSFVADRARSARSSDPLSQGALAALIPQQVYGHASNVIQGFGYQMADAKRRMVAYSLNLRRADDATELACLRSIVESGAAGIAAWVVNSEGHTRAYIRELAERRFPLVLFDRGLRGVATDSVVTDNRKLAYDLTSALLSRGHRRIGFAGVEHPAAMSVEDRLAGYRAALEEAGIPFDARLVLDLQDLHHATTAALALREAPTAFVCTFEEPLNMLLELLPEFGYRVRDDIAFAVVSDYPEGLPDIPLIRIAQDGRAIGAKSAELLLARIEDPARPIEKCVIAPGTLTENADSYRVTRAAVS